MNWEDVMRQQGGGVEFDLGDIFSEMFGGAARGTRRAYQNRRGEDIQIDMELSFEEAAFGVKKEITLRKGAKCGKCSGNGAEPGTPIKECTTCQGTGAVESIQRSIFGAVRRQALCHDCAGKGKKVEKPCTQCSGNGIEKKESIIEVEIPSGIDDGQTIRVNGQGEAGEHGAASGDLYVTVHVKSKKGWHRDGDNVHSEVDVPYATLVLGGKIHIDTLDGEMEVKVPAGTQSGKSLRLKGKGIPHLHGSGRGDHLVQVHVIIAKKPSSKEKKLLKQLQDLQS